jgi:hypothetical protein
MEKSNLDSKFIGYDAGDPVGSMNDKTRGKNSHACVSLSCRHEAIYQQGFQYCTSECTSLKRAYL